MPAVATTERLLLRTITATDAAFLLELLNSPGWLTYIGDRGVRNLAQAETYIRERFLPSYEQYGFGFWVMELLETGMAIGICGLVKRPQLMRPDLGFAILPAYERKGYTREASQAVLTLAVQQYQLPQVDAIVLPDHTASIGLLKNLGFEHTGQVYYEETWLDQYAWLPEAVRTA